MLLMAVIAPCLLATSNEASAIPKGGYYTTPAPYTTTTYATPKYYTTAAPYTTTTYKPAPVYYSPPAYTTEAPK